MNQPSETPRVLPGELTAEEILNGAYPFPASPQFPVTEDTGGLALERLTKTPPPGVHPRILFGPDDLPDLRRRLAETQAGRTMLQTLRGRTSGTFSNPDHWERQLFEKLAAGDTAAALVIVSQKLPPSYPAGHYQPHILYALVMEAFDALLRDDPVQGEQVGSAIAGYARMLAPLLEEALQQPLADDVWRAKIAGPTTGQWTEDQGLREIIGYHLLGYAYDFAHNFMDEAQRASVRAVIARATAGRIWEGASLPHHWRNWNWVVIGLGHPLLALAIEGEEGYDPRLYKLGVEIARDYLTYGVSPSGCATEAVGYCQFGFVWGNPFIVAAARRGDNLLAHGHHRAMIEWYLHSMEPFAPLSIKTLETDAERLEHHVPPHWTSHGDGGDEGPSVPTVMMWKHFFPDDPRIDFLWQMVIHGGMEAPLQGRFHVIEPLIWAADGGRQATSIAGTDMAALGLPPTWFDPERGSLIARSGWDTDALALQFECRTDSQSASHEHADRGNFTLSALGRRWARESFRSVETRHHNNVLIDGMGQGFWPGPGRWLGHRDAGWALIAACDAKDAYDWWWPKTIVTDDPEQSPRFRFARWASFRQEAEEFRRRYGRETMERDPRPAVAAHFAGFEQGDPRMWDEDGWPLRLTHNPVQRAFRTVAMVREGRPYALVVDDIQKDDQERLYEWLMMTGPDTDVAAMAENDIVLCDAAGERDANGHRRPRPGERQLLVRVLRAADPAAPHAYQSRPSARLETFEKKDTLAPGGRTYGPDRRLVIGSRAVAPDFKILLLPHRQGEPLPTTTWNTAQDVLLLQWPEGPADEIRFTRGEDGRTRLAMTRDRNLKAVLS